MTTADTNPLAEKYAGRVMAPDLLDFSFALGDVSLEFANLARLLQNADECGAQRGPTLRAHLDELRHMAADAAALVVEAEAEAA